MPNYLAMLNAATPSVVKSLQGADGNNVTDIIYRKDPLIWHILSKKTSVGEGNPNPLSVMKGARYIECPVSFRKAYGGPYGQGVKLNFTSQDEATSARYTWSYLTTHATVGIQTLVENEGNEKAYFNIMENKIRTVMEGMPDVMSTCLHSQRSSMLTDTTYGEGIAVTGATADKFMYGMGDLFNTTTTTAFGNIQESEISRWGARATGSAGHAPTNNGTVMGYDLVSDMINDSRVRDTQDGRANLIVTTYDLANAYKKAQQPQVRYGSYKDEKMLEAGFDDHITHDGIPLIGSSFCGSGIVYALNTRFLDIVTHEKYNFGSAKAIEWREISTDSPGNLACVCLWVGQFITNHRLAHVKRTSITAAS